MLLWKPIRKHIEHFFSRNEFNDTLTEICSTYIYKECRLVEASHSLYFSFGLASLPSDSFAKALIWISMENYHQKLFKSMFCSITKKIKRRHKKLSLKFISLSVRFGGAVVTRCLSLLQTWLESWLLQPRFDSMPHIGCVSSLHSQCLVVFTHAFSSTVRRSWNCSDSDWDCLIRPRQVWPA